MDKTAETQEVLLHLTYFIIKHTINLYNLHDIVGKKYIDKCCGGS